MFTVATVFGTRPEAIKLAPVVAAIEADPALRSRVIVTAQHRELLDQALAPFGIVPDVDLDLMRAGHGLNDLTRRVLEGMDRVLADERPDLMLVQGDTTTVFAAALAAFYRGIPIGHVEAGLRSFDLANPFPEEANRRLATQITALHLAPTIRAAENLLREQVPSDRVHLTGNTVVDALMSVAARPDLPPPPPAWREPARHPAARVLVTLHRRESWGRPLEGICRALRAAADELEDLHIVYPVHPQPRVRETVVPMLGDHPRIELVEPLDYLHNVAAMSACSFLVTDSGGLQEEAPVLAKPVLVLREVTERPEAVEAGTSWLVGVEECAVREAVVTLATDRDRYDRMAHAVSPYGDGRASERIVDAIRSLAGLPRRTTAPPPLWSPAQAEAA
ncbi:MAG: non-hydrolyzing UDP-N-acetylglucosamine 2-epimerase [Solirubrobacteraceae bacterium]